MNKGLYSQERVDIVVIDDDKTNVDIISKYFKLKSDFITENHYDPLFTLSLIKTRKPRLAIINLNITRFDPLSIIKSMYASEEAKNIPIIILSDGENPEKIKQAMFFGASEMITLPLSIQVLSRKVAKYLKIDVSDVEKKKSKFEINVSNNIMIIEISGYLFLESLLDYNLEIDKALNLFDKHAVKKALIIFYDVDIESLTDENIDLIFDFFEKTPVESTDFIKIISGGDDITQRLKTHLNSKRFEIVSDYIEGINKLEMASLNRELGIGIDFLNPNITLVDNMYDKNGKLIKKAYEILTENDIYNFKLDGIDRVFYEKDLEKLNKLAQKNNDLEQIRFDKALNFLDPANIKSIEKDTSGLFAFLKNKTILIIEDDKNMLDILSKFLATKGFNVLTTMDSRKALELAITKKPDLIITDIMMPNVDGYAFLESLNNEVKNRPPVIVITCAPTGENVKKAKNLGVNAFVPKPIDFKTLFVKIAKELKNIYSKPVEI